MTENKTLKQIIQEATMTVRHCLDCGEYNPDEAYHNADHAVLSDKVIHADRVTSIIKEWLSQKSQPVDGCQMRNNVKALLVLQGKQQMIDELLEELGVGQ